MDNKLSPIIFKTLDKTYRVKKRKMYQNKYSHDTAYIMSKANGYVYPYRGEIDNEEYAYQPGIYLYNGETIIVRPRTDEEKKIYSMSRLIELTPDSIFKDLNDDIQEIPEIVVSDGDIFKPRITSEDDILLALMKYGLGEKEIVYNAYTNEFPDVATKNNTRRAITHGTSMKYSMVERICKIFGINFIAGIWDKKNVSNPMSKDGKKKLYLVSNSDEDIDVKDKNLEIVWVN